MQLTVGQSARLKAVLLGVFLLCAQSASLAHETLHSAYGEPAPCGTCTLGSNLTNVAADSDTVIEAPVVATPLAAIVGTRRISATLTPHLARGPPEQL